MSANIPRPTIILTGGSRGIGLSCLKLLLKSPTRTNVVSLSRSCPSELQDLKRLYHDNLLIIQGDVKRDEDNKLAVESALKSFGSIDGLILNSGVIKFERLDSNTSLESWKDVFNVNFFSLVSILKHSLVHLRKSNGKVIFVSSGAAVGGLASWGSYNSSKAAMNSLCRTLASEEPKITSIAVRPGVVDTEMQSQLRSEGKDVMLDPNYKHFHGLFESSKLLPPEAPAQVIANLSINADAKLTGQFLSWDSEELSTYRKPL